MSSILNFNSTPPAAAENDQAAAALAAAMPSKPNLLKVAEQAFHRLRAEQAIVQQRLTSICQIAHAKGEQATRADQDDIRQLEAEVAAFEPKLRAARAELDKRRSDYAAKARESLGTALDGYVKTVNKRIDELEALLRALSEVETSAALNVIELQGIVHRAPALREQIYAMRRILRGTN